MICGDSDQHNSYCLEGSAALQGSPKNVPSFSQVWEKEEQACLFLSAGSERSGVVGFWGTEGQ